MAERNSLNYNEKRSNFVQNDGKGRQRRLLSLLSCNHIALSKRQLF